MEFFDPYRYLKRLQAARAQSPDNAAADQPDAAVAQVAEAAALPDTLTEPTAPPEPADAAPSRRASPLAGIADTLKIERIRRGLTQRQLGQLAGVPQSHISKIESGAVDLRLTSLFEIARVLNLSVRLEPAPQTDQ